MLRLGCACVLCGRYLINVQNVDAEFAHRVEGGAALALIAVFFAAR